MSHPGPRQSRASDTQAALMAAAERLYAERGIFGVSNRQVSEAAGQGNNAAVAYHFGSKTDLIRAIVVRHTTQIERIREQQLDGHGDHSDLRRWLSCLIRPVTIHLSTLGTPSWYARFIAQVLTDPNLRGIMQQASRSSAALQATLAGMHRSTQDLPDEVRAARGEMARTLMIHVTADHERLMAERPADPASNWDDVGTDLIDALFGLWHAPVSR